MCSVQAQEAWQLFLPERREGCELLCPSLVVAAGAAVKAHVPGLQDALPPEADVGDGETNPTEIRGPPRKDAWHPTWKSSEPIGKMEAKVNKEALEAKMLEAKERGKLRISWGHLSVPAGRHLLDPVASWLQAQNALVPSRGCASAGNVCRPLTRTQLAPSEVVAKLSRRFEVVLKLCW